MHVIFTDHEDHDQVHLFTADVSSAFLARFDYPGIAPPAPTGLSIRHTTVPFKPYSTLYARLLRIIIPEWHIDVLRRRQERIDEVVRAMQGWVPVKQWQDNDPQCLDQNRQPVASFIEERADPVCDMGGSIPAGSIWPTALHDAV